MNPPDDDSEDASVSWQTIPTKRDHHSPELQKKKQKRDGHPSNYMRTQTSTDQPSTSRSATANRFEELSTEDDDIPTAAAVPKPPPLYIPNVANIILMVNSIKDIIPSTDFNYKSVRQGEIRLMTKSIDSYRKIVKYFDSNKVVYHTYQIKQERAYRVVIKGIHSTTPIDDIKAELISLGHPVRAVTNVRSRFNKEPLAMFFVDLNPSPNNKTIYDLQYLCHAVVRVEPPARTNDVVQCHRCQQFGHTKTYCKKPFRCVKCGMDHPTAGCQKNKDTPPRCLHCLMNHTASYKGCRIYQNIVSKRRNNQLQINRHQNNFQLNQNDYPNLSGQTNDENITNNIKYNMSYAEAARPQVNDNARLERLEKMMENLMNMMSMILSRQCN